MKIKLTHICFCVALFLEGCYGQNIDMMRADLRRLKPFPASNNGIPVSLLESFEAAPCKQDVLSANVYKVKLAQQGDTLFVFETCKEMTFTNKDEGLFVVVKSPDVTDQILIPSNSNIPNGSKYLFGTLKRAKF